MKKLESIILNSPYWIRQIAINFYGYILARKRFSGDFSSIFQSYCNNLSKTPAQIEEEQFMLLKDNLIYCLENIPYYKKVFNEVNFNPYQMNNLKDIEKIPFLNKDIIRTQFDSLYNKDIPSHKYKLHETSGSTGEKLKFFLPNELMYKKNTALIYRFYQMAGVMPKDKRVTVGGRRFSNRRPFWSINYFENQLLISSHHLFKPYLLDYLKRICQFKPIFIQGHPSAILVLAEHILESNSPYHLPLKAIFTTGESLVTNDKATIEKAFKTKVYQQYGSGENCFSAQEAPDESGYLINYEHGFIELIGDGEEKEVVVTSLQNKVMPFVRYKLGDYVLPVKNHYSKKYGLPILFKEVIGRIDDVLFDEKGNKILPVSIRMNVKPFLGKGANYQLIQNGLKEFSLNLLDPERKIPKSELVNKLKTVLGPNTSISCFYVDNLFTKGGKIRNVIQDLK